MLRDLWRKIYVLCVMAFKQDGILWTVFTRGSKRVDKLSEKTVSLFAAPRKLSPLIDQCFLDCFWSLEVAADLFRAEEPKHLSVTSNLSGSARRPHAQKWYLNERTSIWTLLRCYMAKADPAVWWATEVPQHSVRRPSEGMWRSHNEGQISHAPCSVINHTALKP